MLVVVAAAHIVVQKERAVPVLVAMVEITYQPHRKLDNPTPEAVAVVVLVIIAVRHQARAVPAL
jgi:ribosome biogenesis protein Tsr3